MNFLNIALFFAEYAIWIIFLAPVWLALRHKSRLAAHAATAAFLVWLIGEFIKRFFFSPRPFIPNAEFIPIRLLLDGAFPSNHTAVSFAISFSIFYSARHLGTWLLLISLLIGVGRIVIRVHHPIDVLGGVILGFLASYITRKAVFRH